MSRFQIADAPVGTRQASVSTGAGPRTKCPHEKPQFPRWRRVSRQEARTLSADSAANVCWVGFRNGRFSESHKTSNEQLHLEFAYTTRDDSCRNLYSVHYLCRRPAGHQGNHAAGFGSD